MSNENVGCVNARLSTCGFRADDGCINSNPDMKHRFWLRTFDKTENYECTVVRYDSLMFVLDGEVELTINDRKYHLAVGQMLLVPIFSVVSTNVVTDTVKVLALTIKPGSFNLCISRMFGSNIDFVNGVARFSEPMTICPAISTFISSMEYVLLHVPHCDMMQSHKMYELGMLISLNYTFEQIQKLFAPMIRANNDFVHNVNQLLDKFTSVEDMAKEMGMSLSGFNSVFKSTFNETPYKWLLKQKSQLIFQYISSHMCTTTELVEKFGFSSPSHFHRFCLSQYGCTSSELLKRTLSSTVK